METGENRSMTKKMMYPMTETVPVEDQVRFDNAGQVPESVKALEHVVGKVAEEVSHLLGRIEPVLLPQEPSDKLESPPVHQDLKASLANELDSLAGRLDMVLFRVLDAHHRLSL